MAVETFDQRFKRLTSDLLMLDICRILGIEVRELMKIRSGIRVKLNMDRVRRLCADQGLDFASFVRDYEAPWSAELKPAQTVTSDTPAPVRRRPVEAAAQTEAPAKTTPTVTYAPATPSEASRFRADGSRTGGKPAAPAPVPAPVMVDEEPEYKEHDDEPVRGGGTSVVGRLKAVVAGAASLLGSRDNGRDELEHIPSVSAEVDAYNYPEPRKAGTSSWGPVDSKALQTVLDEVSDIKREVTLLSNRINELIGR